VVGPGVVPVRLRAVPAPPGATPGFTVQVGAFGSEAGASTLQKVLADSGFEAQVARGDAGGQPIWRVRSGSFATRAEADAHASKLARAGYRAFIVTD
jgi:cell division protein FtsN